MYSPASRRSCPAAPQRGRFSGTSHLLSPLPPNKVPRIPPPSPFYSRGQIQAWLPCRHGIPNRGSRMPLPDVPWSIKEILLCASYAHYAPPPHGCHRRYCRELHGSNLLLRAGKPPASSGCRRQPQIPSETPSPLPPSLQRLPDTGHPLSENHSLSPYSIPPAQGSRFHSCCNIVLFPL